MTLHYNPRLKSFSRTLRNNMTNSERLLWRYIRRKQLLGVQFFRQKPLGNYIVDFYAAKTKLVVEVDGSQHFEEKYKVRDALRDLFFKKQGIRVLRFDNLEVLQNIDGVVEVIVKVLEERLEDIIKSPRPSFSKGEFVGER